MSLTKLGLVLMLATGACGGPLPAARKAAQKQSHDQVKKLETAGLIIGEFGLASNAVVDGDTIKVIGLDASLRLLGIDAEETFKHDKERRAYEAGWEAYLKAQRGNSAHPVKMATPIGDEGKHFAQEFFAGVTTVRLERDHPKEIRDYYNRYLAYVFAEKDGKWLNYNVEIVRAGLSPYFSKYGYSRRFHDDFVAAEQEARAAKRGIWDATKQHYPDYEERKVWWDARAEFIAAFEKEMVGKENWIELTNSDAIDRLEKHVGKEVIVLGAISSIKGGDKGPTRIMLSRKRTNDFPLIVWDRDVFAATGAEKHQSEYVRVRGFVSRYMNPQWKKYELQIVIDLPSQVSTSSVESKGPDEEEDFN
jgi:endonuclease YncB( thermonuclease family)